MPAPDHAMAQGIEGEIGDFEDHRSGQPRSPEQGVDAGEQLGEAKGLHQVVIGSRIEASDAILQRVSVGEEAVEDDDVVVVDTCELVARARGMGEVYREALLAKSLGQELGSLAIVLDDQGSHDGAKVPFTLAPRQAPDLHEFLM